MNSIKKPKDRTLKDELPRLIGAQFATGEEWRNSSRKNEERKKNEVTQSCPTPCDPMEPSRLLCPWDFPGKSTGVGCHFLLQGIFPTQGSNQGPLHCRQTCYHHLSRESSDKRKHEEAEPKAKTAPSRGCD